MIAMLFLTTMMMLLTMTMTIILKDDHDDHDCIIMTEPNQADEVN